MVDPALDRDADVGVEAIDLSEADGTVLINPPMDTIIGEDDLMIVLAEDDLLIRLATTLTEGVLDRWFRMRLP